MRTLLPKNQWHKTEVAIYGTTCEAVQAKMASIQAYCSKRRLVYIDASHKESSDFQHAQLTTFTNHVELKSSSELDETVLLEFDGAVVNGNHHQASKQVVVVNSEKENSLRKRKAELTNVSAILLPEHYTEVPAFIWECVSAETKVIIEGSEEEASFWKEVFPIPSLKALILLGGKSSRMGEEKGLIHYGEESQATYLTNLFSELGMEVHLSCRPEQATLYEDLNLPFVFDLVQGGPLGGILSALRSFPNTAFFVVACDLPNLSKSVLVDLIEARQAQLFATCFESPMDGGPEPLCSIYEPKSASALAQVWANGKNCPRKMLFNREVAVIPILDKELLANANTPEERERIKRRP